MSEKESKEPKALTGKQKIFVEAYIGEARFNATEAARIAGLRHPNKQGPRELVKVGIKQAIAARLDEAAMSANEVLFRLTEIARGDADDFLDEQGRFDLQRIRERKKTGLIKKIKQKNTSKKVDKYETEGDEPETIETSLVYQEIEFELYSAPEALALLGKHHKLFTEKHEHSFDLSNLSDEELIKLAELRAKLNT
jgi:phage terminase small subunit